MDILFVNLTPTPESPPNDANSSRLRIPRLRLRGKDWGPILAEQLLNSILVGLIAGGSAWAAGAPGWKAPVIAFGLTAAIELRKYWQGK